MFECKFQTDNAAFDDGREAEVCRILREIADRIERGDAASGKHRNALDVNGNVVGTFKLSNAGE